MTPDPPDDATRDAGLVDALSARLDNFERHATGHLVGWIQASGLSLAELQVFLALADGEPKEGGQLAAESGVPVELAYPALHKLAAHGWLEEENRRHWLSAAGRDKLEELAAVRHAAVKDFVAGLSPQERHELAAAMGTTRG
jgi:DNA-binding MarR family transcriptional regulator